MLYYSMPALAAGFILDLMIGDPRWLYHPVCRSVSCLSVKRGNPIPDPAYSLRDFSMGGICTGDLLVLSASGNEISENREHESL